MEPASGTNTNAGQPPESGNASQTRAATWWIALLAALPFAVKIVSLAWLTHSYVAQSLYKVVQLAVPVAWRHGQKQRLLACLWPIDEPLPDARTWLLAVAIAAASIGSSAVLLPVLASRLGIEPTEIRTHFDATFSVTPWRALVVVAYLTLINSALEELHFRAWLDREISARHGSVVGIAVSSVTFAAMHTLIFYRMPHLNGAVLAVIFGALAIDATMWSLLMRRRGGIHAAWLSHGLTDAGFLTWGLFWLGYFSP